MIDAERRSLALLYLTAFTHGMVSVGFVTIASFLRAPLGMSDVAYGLIYLPFFAASGLGNLSAPRARHALGGHAVFALGMAVAALAYLLLGVVRVLEPSLGRALLYAAAACLGGGTGFCGVVLNAGVLERPTRGAENPVVLLHGTLGLGACIAPALAVLLRDRISPFAFPAMGCLLLSVEGSLGWRWLGGPRGDRAPELHLGRHRALLVFAAIALLYGLAESTFSNWAVVYLTSGVGLDRVPAARSLSLFWFGITAGRLLLARFLDRRWVHPTSMLLAIGMAAAFVALPRIDGPNSALLAYGAAGLACSAVFPLLLDLATRQVPGEATLCASVLGVGLLIGLALGSAGISPLIAARGWRFVYLASAVGPLLLAGLLRAVEAKV